MRFILLVVSFLITGVSYAQMGYFSSTEVIKDLPEIKAADIQLIALQDSLSNALNANRIKLQQEFNKHQEDYNNGLLSTKEIQEISTKLNSQQEALNKQESQFQFILIQRREVLYQPTFDKIDQILKNVAQEGEYRVIFDKSQQGGYLYLDPSLDITELIKAKL